MTAVAQEKNNQHLDFDDGREVSADAALDHRRSYLTNYMIELVFFFTSKYYTILWKPACKVSKRQRRWFSEVRYFFFFFCQSHRYFP